MPRKSRELSITAKYHVMLRGINGQRIFEEEEDFFFFLNILRSLVSTGKTPHGNVSFGKVEILSYVLMDNHVHLLIHPQASKIGPVMQAIEVSYSQYYNKLYGRRGQLYQERFRSEPVESEEYLLTLFRYIHQNPSKAGRVRRAVDYPFSSYHEYFGGGQFQICKKDEILNLKPLEELKALIDMPLGQKCDEINRRWHNDLRKRISDREIQKIVKTHYGLENCTLIQAESRELRNEILTYLLAAGAGVRQLERLTGIGKTIISRLNREGTTKDLMAPKAEQKPA